MYVSKLTALIVLLDESLMEQPVPVSLFDLYLKHRPIGRNLRKEDITMDASDPGSISDHDNNRPSVPLHNGKHTAL